MNRGVAIASVGLVAAVWGSLQLSQRVPAAGGDVQPVAVPDMGSVPGFRADAWSLPDDELLGFVEVEGGPFLMGSDPATDPAAFDIERWSATRVQGSVEVPTFFIGRFEVTVAQYAAFVGAAGHRVADERAFQSPPDHPVAFVAWTDALAYGRWLDRTLREWTGTPAPLREALASGATVTLPTEAEWEKAARGPEGRLYPWGSGPPQGRANFGARRAVPVGSFDCPECAYALSDMSGNVWEWTRSPYQPYPYSQDDDRSGLEAEALWIMRGGSFADPPQYLRGANRGGADPGSRRPIIGFRVVISGS